jgi:hypothetical protein
MLDISVADTGEIHQGEYIWNYRDNTSVSYVAVLVKGMELSHISWLPGIVGNPKIMNGYILSEDKVDLSSYWKVFSHNRFTSIISGRFTFNFNIDLNWKLSN